MSEEKKMSPREATMAVVSVEVDLCAMALEDAARELRPPRDGEPVGDAVRAAALVRYELAAMKYEVATLMYERVAGGYVPELETEEARS